mgnify:FL=1
MTDYRQAYVSIHAPRVGRDRFRNCRFIDNDVSIHAPRVGRDKFSLFFLRQLKSFNPRAPRGARRL